MRLPAGNTRWSETARRGKSPAVRGGWSRSAGREMRTSPLPVRNARRRDVGPRPGQVLCDQKPVQFPEHPIGGVGQRRAGGRPQENRCQDPLHRATKVEPPARVEKAPRPSRENAELGAVPDITLASAAGMSLGHWKVLDFGCPCELHMTPRRFMIWIMTRSRRGSSPMDCVPPMRFRSGGRCTGIWRRIRDRPPTRLPFSDGWRLASDPPCIATFP